MTDLYQLTMAAGYFRHGLHTKRVTFELFARRLPPHRRFMLFMGLKTAVEYLRDLRFTDEQITYLKDVPPLAEAMRPDFVDFLRDFRFRGDVWAMPEGTVCFAQEPMLRVTGSLLETQLVETFLLSAVNTETMVASKAARIVLAADGRDLLEFGSRRTSPHEAVASARAAYAAGFSATSNVEAGFRYSIPVAGTAAHSWTMAYGNEPEAFRAYVEVYPQHATLLVDTYDTVEGVKRAIAVAGPRLRGIRLDSGDLGALAHASRKLLDDAGLTDTKIVVSGDLNETSIAALIAARAPIDAFGVGTELARSRDAPTLGGVYKLVYDHAEERPVAKFAEGKATLPGVHQVFRKYRDQVAVGDVIATDTESVNDATPLLVEVMKDGQLRRELPSVAEVRRHAEAQLQALPTSTQSIADTDADPYPVSLSSEVQSLIAAARRAHQGEMK